MLAEMGVRLWAPPSAPDRENSTDDLACEAEPVAARHGVTDARARAGVIEAAAVSVPHPKARPLASPASPRTQPSAVEALDWPALRDTVAACTACPLCQSRRQTVFGVGHPRAHWMIVGEAPGEQEDRQGEPFVGKSGQLLDNMLRAIGLTRSEAPPAEQVYIANTVKCRPPNNRNPGSDEMARCEPYLIRQLQLVQPRIILAMGRFAVQSLLRSSEPIGRLRGRVHQFAAVPLIVTYHPAYLLRNLADKARAWDDLCLAVETLRRADTG